MSQIQEVDFYEQIDKAEHQEPEQLPAKDLVFSNHLLVDMIWKHLSTQDLLQAMLVSVDWCANSRKALLSNRKKHEVCFHINSDEDPCWKMLELNTFLEENYASNPEIDIIINGVHLNYDHEAYPDKPECEDCLLKVWLIEHCNKGGTMHPVEEVNRMILDKLLQSYGTLLTKMKFKYITLLRTFSLTCPFAILLKSVLQLRPEDTLKLDFGSGIYPSEQGAPYLLWNDAQEDDTPRLFANLEVLGAPHLEDRQGRAGLPILAPKLKRLDHFYYSPVDPSYDSLHNFPYHCVTDLDQIPLSSEAAKTVMEFTGAFKPPIFYLYFSWRHDIRSDMDQLYSDEHQLDLFHLGRNVSGTVTHLACSPVFLNYLVSRAEISADTLWEMVKTKNCFPCIATLKLVGGMTVAGMDLFCDTDFSEHFPKLEEVSFELYTKVDSIFYGPYNKVQDSRGFKKDIKIEWMPMPLEEHSPAAIADFTHSVLRISLFFPNIRVIELSPRFAATSHDQSFELILNAIEDLPCVEVIEVGFTNGLRNLCLDHFFQENIVEIEEQEFPLEEAQVAPARFHKGPVLRHNSLRQITIGGCAICMTFGNDDEEEQDGEEEQVGEEEQDGEEEQGKETDEAVVEAINNEMSTTFLVSCRVAEAITEHRPGFKFHIRIANVCEDICSNAIGPGGLHFEHLEPQAKIKYLEPKYCSSNAFYDVEFLRKENGEAFLHRAAMSVRKLEKVL